MAANDICSFLLDFNGTSYQVVSFEKNCNILGYCPTRNNADQVNLSRNTEKYCSYVKDIMEREGGCKSILKFVAFLLIVIIALQVIICIVLWHKSKDKRLSDKEKRTRDPGSAGNTSWQRHGRAAQHLHTGSRVHWRRWRGDWWSSEDWGTSQT